MDIKSLGAAYSSVLNKSQSPHSTTVNNLHDTKRVVSELKNTTVTLSTEALKLAADDRLVSSLSAGGTQPPPLKPPVQK